MVPLHSLPRKVQILLIINLALISFLFICAATFFRSSRWESPKGQESGSNFALKILEQQSDAISSLLTAELEKTRQDAKSMAELATHIFTYPESYRLAAQPGEYDYDDATKTYGSVRNDGSSVTVLSAAGSLTPEILREIRLSEYLNPVFKNSANLNPAYRQISLYTIDSLIRSYPWFDFRKEIESGLLKKDFIVSNFSFFSKASPSRNPRQEAVCDLLTAENKDLQTRVVCVAPFFSATTFRGVLAIHVDVQELSKKIHQTAQTPNALMFLLGSGDIVLGLNQAMEKSMKMIKGRPAEESSALTLRDLQSRTNAEVAMVLKQLPKSERYSGQIGEFYVQTAPLEIVPLKLVTLFSEAGTRQLGIAPVTSNTRLSARSWIVWTSVGLVLLLNSFWILETQKNLRLTSQKLADSFTALSDLNLNSALLDDQKGFMGDLFKRFNESVESLRKVLEAPRNPGSEENPNRVSVKNAEEDLQLITCKLGILSCFDPGDSIGENLSRLSMSLVEIFGVRQVVFLFFSPSDQTLRARWVGMEAEFGSLDTRKPSLEIKKGKLFECLINSKELYISNSPDFSHEGQDGLFSWVERNFLAAPLLDRDKVLGAILLADKPGEFTSVDRGLLLQLQEPISRVLKNLYQYEGLHKIDMLRREYCHELSRAVEAPLNRIRNEVQSILSRLGKLTPYYKQHCDTILFEVGKLYEIVREVREVEPPQEGILSATKIQDGS